MNITIPEDLRPVDGRFGAGPSKIRDAQFLSLLDDRRRLVGTSHRQAAVKRLVHRIKMQLLELFDAPAGYEIVMGNGGSTAFWDVAAFSLIEKRSQHLVFGEFGRSFATATKAPWLDAPDVIEAAAGSRSSAAPREGIDVYAWPQNETSTGVAAPVSRLGAPDALTVIDATSSAGAMAFDPRECDVYYFAPQKNFGSDGGLWVALMSPAAIERTERISRSGRYIPSFLSLMKAIDNSRLDQTFNTPALVTLHLLESQLSWIAEHGGLAWASEKAKASTDLLYAWAESSVEASPFVAERDHRSPVVATIDFSDRVDAAELARMLRQNGILDVEPYRKLGRNQLRICTYVSVDLDDVQRLTRSIDYVLERMLP